MFRSTILAAMLLVWADAGAPGFACEKAGCGSGIAFLGGLYGGTSASPGIAGKSGSPLAASRWQLTRAPTGAGEAENAYLFLPGRRGKDYTPANMLIRCRNDNTAVIFEFPGEAMSGHRELSEFHLTINGASEGVIELGGAAGDAPLGKRVLGLWRGYRAIPFIKQIATAREFVLKGRNAAREPVAARFDIAGLAAHLPTLRRACHW